MRQAAVRHSDGVASADPVSVGDPARRRSSHSGLSVPPESAVRRFRGESITLERALRRGLDRFLSILGASLLLTLLLLALVFVPFLLILLPFTGGTTNPPVAFGAICGGFAVLVIGGLIALYVIVATGLYAPAIMMENANGTEGLMRGWRLTKRHWWSLFGALLVA